MPLTDQAAYQAFNSLKKNRLTAMSIPESSCIFIKNDFKISTYDGCPSKSWDLCCKTRLSIGNYMKFVYLNVHLQHILYKYGWNQSLDNKVMNLYLRVSLRRWGTSQIILLYFQRGVVKSFGPTLLKYA